MSTLHITISGILTTPPPAPTKLEITPTIPEPAAIPTLPGSRLLGLGFTSSSICVAE
jgi:hypothetical protein